MAEVKHPQQLDPKVGDALLDEDDVMSIMQHPKMVAAIEKIKKDNSAYQRLVDEDAELKQMFATLNSKMTEKEQQRDKAGAATASEPTRKLTMDSPSELGADVPPLAEEDALACEAARKAGTAAFEAGDYATASDQYAIAAAFEPHHAPHWTNLSVARLRSGKAAAALEAAREAARRNPRFAKAWLRLGEAQHALGQHDEAIETFEAGLKRAEGAIRLALTKSLQRAQQAVSRSATALGGQGAGKAAEAAGGAGGAWPRGGKGDTTNTAKAPTPTDAPNAAVATASSGVDTTAAERRVPAKPLPSVEEERALAAETAALRRATQDKMAQYAEKAKEQTRLAAARAAATREAVVAREAAANAAVGSVATEAVVEFGPSPPPTDTVATTGSDAAGHPVDAAATPAASASATAMRKVLVVDDDDDVVDDDDVEAAEAVEAAAATARGDDQLDGGAAALGAALAEWSGSPTRPPAAGPPADFSTAGPPLSLPPSPGPQPAPPAQVAPALVPVAAPLARPAQLPGVSLSNNLIFDLA